MFAASIALLVAGILLLKARSLPLVLRERWLLLATFVLFIAFAWHARRATLAPQAPSIVATFVAAIVLAANLANTPLAYELRGYARDLPLPEGAETHEVGARRVYISGHPEVSVTARYAPGRNLTELMRTLIDGFEARGWDVLSATLPNTDATWGAVGFVEVADAPFRATCTTALGGALPTIRCTLRV